jgi:hypothetical protein
MARCASFAIILLLASCTTLPDATGYTAATIEVKQSVAASGAVVEAEITNAAASLGEDSSARDTAGKLAEQFKQAWTPTVASLDAMIAHAQSIEAISAAGNKGGESARRVADSLKTLTNAVGIALPVAAPVGEAVSIAARIYEEIAKVEGAKSLEAALARSGPPLVLIQSKVREQVADARKAFELAIDAQAGALLRQDAYGPYVTIDDLLEQRDRELLPTVGDLTIRVPASPQLASQRAERTRIAEMRATLEPTLEEYRAKLKEIEARRKAGRAVIGAAEDAVSAWASAHAELVAAVRERRPVTMQSLVAAAGEVRAAVQRWREL